MSATCASLPTTNTWSPTARCPSKAWPTPLVSLKTFSMGTHTYFLHPPCSSINSISLANSRPSSRSPSFPASLTKSTASSKPEKAWEVSVNSRISSTRVSSSKGIYYSAGSRSLEGSSTYRIVFLWRVVEVVWVFFFFLNISCGR